MKVCVLMREDIELWCVCGGRAAEGVVHDGLAARGPDQADIIGGLFVLTQHAISRT